MDRIKLGIISDEEFYNRMRKYGAPEEHIDRVKQLDAERLKKKVNENLQDDSVEASYKKKKTKKDI